MNDKTNPAATSGDAPADEKPAAWIRKWAFDGRKPEKEKNSSGRLAWPHKFKLLPVTQHKALSDDVPLFAHIERTTAHVQPVNTSSERVENAAGNEQVERAAAPIEAAVQDAIAGGTGMFRVSRNGSTEHIGEEVWRAAAPSPSESNMQKVHSAPATASGDELPESLVLDMARAACLDTSRISTVIDFAGSVARATVSAATKPKNEQIAEVIAHMIGSGVMDWKASASDEAEWDAMSNEEERRALIHEVNKVMLSRTAATKPTADLSKLTRYHHNSFSLAVHDDPVGEFVYFADVQSLLATKPAAAPGVPEGFVIVPKVPTEEMIAASMAPAIYDGTMHTLARRGNLGVWSKMIAAAPTPAASTIGAAQTAEQVREQALEEAIGKCEKRLHREFPRTIHAVQSCIDAIRALKRPTTTHNSEAAK